MPKLKPINQDIRNQQFLNALEQTNGNSKEAAKIVGKIGSQGAKDPEKSAAVMGSKRLSKVNISILEACENIGVTPAMVASKIKQLLNSADRTAIDKGITHALKIGIGGGYKLEMPIVHPEPNNINFFSNPEVMEATKRLDDVIAKYIASQSK